MSDQFIGEIRIFACNYPPYDWGYCDGQTLSTSQNPALCKVLAGQYGNTTATTFDIPDLSGRAVMGAVSQQLNMPQGSATVKLDSTNLANHSHTINVSEGHPLSNTPVEHLPCRFKNTQNFCYLPASDATTQTMLPQQAVQSVGGGQAHNNMQPYQVLNFCIALNGEYPVRPD